MFGQRASPFESFTCAMEKLAMSTNVTFTCYVLWHSPQTEHKFGFPTTFLNSPVCFFLCFVKLELSAKDILQTEQTCGLFGLWIFKCRFRILFSAKRLLQNSQANFKCFTSSGSCIFCCSSDCCSCISDIIVSVNPLPSVSSSV